MVENLLNYGHPPDNDPYLDNWMKKRQKEL